MDNNFEYYYNNVPGDGLCRNNLIYTSLISKDKKTFCQWYFNDTDYHKGKNVVDPNIMDEKWEREVSFLTRMQNEQPQHVPKIDTNEAIFSKLNSILKLIYVFFLSNEEKISYKKEIQT